MFSDIGGVIGQYLRWAGLLQSIPKTAKLELWKLKQGYLECVKDF